MRLRDRTARQTYKAAGVDIRAAEEVVRQIRRAARATFSPSVLCDIGAFGAFFDGRFRGYRHPVLVSSVDGVGTKLKVAAIMGRHSSVGEDLVNHCVNDILVCGARPLFFLDYVGIGRLDPRVVGELLRGMIKACKENRCALIGGETAEMPGLYQDGDFDLVGAIVGVAEREGLLNGSKVREGDVLLALPSTGLHTNGYSLARKVLLGKFQLHDFIEELGERLGDTLLRIHRSYLQAITALEESVSIHAMAHITGGGIVGNTRRVIPRGLGIELDWSTWERPAIFRLIQTVGNVSESEMRKTFNLGVGLVMILEERETEKAMRSLRRMGESPFVIGSVQKASKRT